MVNANKIKGRMRELCLTQRDIAIRMGVSQAAINQKINNTRSLSLEEAEKLSDILNVSDKDFRAYFFAH